MLAAKICLLFKTLSGLVFDILHNSLYIKNMNDKDPLPEEETSNEISSNKIIEVDSLKPNSVVIFRVGKPDKAIVNALQNFISMYGDILQEKKCSLLVLGKDADLEVLDEKEMNKAGWERKKQSNLILP